MKDHIGEEQLEAYAMHLLAGDELESVEEHLLFCETCQDKLEFAERYVLAMQGAALRVRREIKAPAVSGAWSRLQALLHVPIPIWCGAAALCVLLLLVVRLPHSQPPGTPVDVELQAVRGEAAGTALAGHALRLRLANQGVQYSPDWRIEVVDSEGAGVWGGMGAWSDSAITVLVPKSFTPGTYYVRLLKKDRDPAREYQLVIK
jgi:hypothetical protein